MKHIRNISNSIPIKNKDLETIACVALASGGTACVDNLKVENYFGVVAGAGKVLAGVAFAAASHYRND